MRCNALLSWCISMVAFLGAQGCSSPSATLPYAVNITENRAGSIRPNTPFDAMHIATLMPGFNVDTLSAFEAGHAKKLIRIQRHNVPVMLLTPTSDGKQIDSIAIYHNEVTVQKRITVGHSFNDILKDDTSCHTFSTHQDTFLRCQAPHSNRIYYLFKVSTTPPQLSILSLDHILWIPHANL